MHDSKDIVLKIFECISTWRACEIPKLRKTCRLGFKESGELSLLHGAKMNKMMFFNIFFFNISAMDLTVIVPFLALSIV